MAQKGRYPVSYSRYGHRFWHRASTFDFARHLSECPIVDSELEPTAAAFPIAFRDYETHIAPVALLSMDPTKDTPFVADNGRWLAAYVPSALRCVPFHAEHVFDGSEASNQYGLIVDESLGLVTDDPQDEPFFDPSGELSPELQKVEEFFQTRATAMDTTLRSCRVIDELRLFVPLGQADGAEFPQGLLCIDRARLRSLSQACKLLLLDSFALRLIHAHQVSLAHGRWLAQVQKLAARRASATPGPAAAFMNAVANAQLQEELAYFARLEDAHARC